MTEQVYDIPAPEVLAAIVERLDYCPESGVLSWKDWGSNFARHVGKPVKCKSRYGYVVLSITLNKRQKYQIKAHRAAWFLHTGEWPVCMIDHINGDRADNRFENLRLSDQHKNQANAHGAPCVHYDKRKKRWIVRARKDGKAKRYGMYETESEALEVYKRVSLELHGEHSRFYGDEQR